MPNSSCQVCGKVLQHNQKKYCSRACTYEASRHNKNYKCLYCGKEVIRKPSSIKRYIFCSRKCYDNSRRGKTKPRKGKEFICEVCGKHYYVAPHRFKTSKYCSYKCRHISLQTSIEATCPVCGKSFRQKPSRPQGYCSRKCFQIERKEKRLKSTCPVCNKELRYTPSRAVTYCSVKCRNITQRVKVKCPICQKVFERPFSSPQKYCSRRCACISNITSIEIKCPICQKIFRCLRSLSRIYCSRKCFLIATGSVLSSLEKRIQSILPSNIKFMGNDNYWIYFQDGRRKKPDFILAKKDGTLPKRITKVIEVHGNFWHQDEWNNRGQDLIDKYKQVGIDCLVLWGSEIERDFGQVMKKLSDFLNVEIRQLRLF